MITYLAQFEVELGIVTKTIKKMNCHHEPILEKEKRK